MKKNNLLKSISVFLVMLMLSMVFVPAACAQAESNVAFSSENMIPAENVKMLKDDSDSKIAAVTADDGSVLYSMSWADSKVAGRVNFVLMTEDDLASKGYLTTNSLSDSEIAASVSKASASFWYGSYVQTYGNSLTGGVQIHFSQRDAVMVTSVSTGATGAVVGAAICSVVPGIGTTAGALIGAAVASLVPIYYWRAQNSDGSLDVKISFVVMNAMAIGIPGVGHFILFGHIYHYLK